MSVTAFAAIFAILVAPLVVFLVVKSRRKPGSFIDMSALPWSEAIAKARGSIDTLRDLVKDGVEGIGVKFPVRNTKGEDEHAWGALLDLGDEYFVADLATSLIRGRPTSAPPFRLPLTELEDWLVVLADGSVRGGFTTQLEIEQAERDGASLPDHIRAMAWRFVDV